MTMAGSTQLLTHVAIKTMYERWEDYRQPLMEITQKLYLSFDFSQTILAVYSHVTAPNNPDYKKKLQVKFLLKNRRIELVLIEPCCRLSDETIALFEKYLCKQAKKNLSPIEEVYLHQAQASWQSLCWRQSPKTPKSLFELQVFNKLLSWKQMIFVDDNVKR